MRYTNKEFFDLEKTPAPVKKLLEETETPLEALKEFHKLFDFKGQIIKGTVLEGSQLYGDVYVEEGATIHSGVVIEGPAYIGARTDVMPHSMLRKGVYLCEDCVVGHGADIKNTLAMPGAKMQNDAFAGDSLLGIGARLGTGTILSNRKFNQTEIKIDLGSGFETSHLKYLGAIIGDYSRLGANVVASPGTVVGRHTWVGGGVVLQGSYDANLFVTLKQDVDIRPKDDVELERSGANSDLLHQ